MSRKQGNARISFEMPGLLTAVGVVLVILKLVGVINWSWWLVTLPLWIPWAFLTIWVVGFLLIYGVSELLRK